MTRSVSYVKYAADVVWRIKWFNREYQNIELISEYSHAQVIKYYFEETQ